MVRTTPGQRDEQSIPHTTMRDGAPNGYSIVTFDGHDYSIRFKAARRPADHQMTVFAPDSVSSEDAASTEVVVNVFAGSARSEVSMRFGDDGAWQKLRRVRRVDPYFKMLKNREAAGPEPERKLPNIEVTEHIWVANLPPHAPAGCQLIRIRTTDMYGQTYRANRIIRIVE